LRLCGPEWNSNDGAQKVDPTDPRAARARKAICDRADDQIGHHATEELGERVTRLLQAWREQAEIGQRNLVYRRRGRSDADVSLLQEPGMEGWSRWTVPTSMRNVETAVPLTLRPDAIAAPESWESPERSAALPKEKNTG
jgi:hypothetical protein